MDANDARGAAVQGGPGGGARAHSPVPPQGPRPHSQSPPAPSQQLHKEGPHSFRQWLQDNVSASSTGAFEGMEDLKIVGGQSAASLFVNRTLSLATAFPIPVLAELANSIPQIIVTGDQSAGKSTMLEALVGFRFNVVASGMATKRPLVIHMIPSAEHLIPECTLAEPNGSPTLVDVQDLAAAVTERQPRGITVIADPLLLTIRYSSFTYGQEIRIVDLPGLRSRGSGAAISDEQRQLAEQIHKITKNYLDLRKDSIWLVMLGDGEVNNLTAPSFLKEIVDAQSMTRPPILLISKFQKRLTDWQSGGKGVEQMKKFFEDPSDGLGNICKLWSDCYLLEFTPSLFVYDESYVEPSNPTKETKKGNPKDDFNVQAEAWRKHCTSTNQAMLAQAIEKGVKSHLKNIENYLFDSMKKDMMEVLDAEYSKRSQYVYQKLLAAASDCEDMSLQILAEKSALKSFDARHCIDQQKHILLMHFRNQWTNAGSDNSLGDAKHVALFYYTAVREKAQPNCDWNLCFEHQQNRSLDNKMLIKPANVDQHFVAANICDLESLLIGGAAVKRLLVEFKLVLMNANMEDAGSTEIGNALTHGFAGYGGNAADPQIPIRQVALNRARKLKLILLPFINRLRDIFERFVQHSCCTFGILKQLQSWPDVTREIRCVFRDAILEVVRKQVDLLQEKLEDCFYTNTLTADDSLVYGAPNCDVPVEDFGKFLADRLKTSVSQLTFRAKDWKTEEPNLEVRNKFVNHNAKQFFCGIRHLLGMSVNSFVFRYIDEFMMGHTPPATEGTPVGVIQTIEAYFHDHSILPDLIASITMKTQPRMDQLQNQHEFLQNVIGEITKLRVFYNARVLQGRGH
jgi:GTP-binding protein EngB required for normal cell division